MPTEFNGTNCFSTSIASIPSLPSRTNQPTPQDRQSTSRMPNSIGGNLSSSFIIQLLGAQNPSMQLAHNIFFAVVLGLLLPPLYRLSKERSALFILFSKAGILRDILRGIC